MSEPDSASSTTIVAKQQPENVPSLPRSTNSIALSAPRSSNLSQSQRDRNNNTGRRFGINNLQDKFFEGRTPEKGGVLALPAEVSVAKRVSFEKFQDLLKNYILKNFGEGASLVILRAIRKLEGPLDAFVKQEIPQNVEDAKAGSIKELILK